MHFAQKEPQGISSPPWRKDPIDWSRIGRSGHPSDPILAGARGSKLSRIQVEEMAQELGVCFTCAWVEDLDKTTSLRGLEKSDFFTRQLDQMLLCGEIDVAIHSAKDLPDPLPKGLKIAYLSQGLDPRDSLVIQREPVKVVATSSIRREEAVKKLFPECTVVDIRGTIEERLKADVDGVVIAEAALIRLKLTHLPRIYLPGETAPLQGKIAVLCREDLCI